MFHNRVRHIFIAILFICTIAPPLPASAVSTADLLTQIQSLLKVVEQLQQQLAELNGTPTTTTAPTTDGLNLFRPLYIGTKGSDVTQLQTFLKSTGDFTYPSITGYYGSVTAKAVQRYQCREMQICAGTPSDNGYGVVGPKTRKGLARRKITPTQQPIAPYTPTYVPTTPTNPSTPITPVVTPTPTPTPTPIPTASQKCTLNGIDITHGQSSTFYQSASVPFGQACVSQLRACSNGTLSGSYTNANCTIGVQPTKDPMLACGITESRLQQIRSLVDEVVDRTGPEHLIASAEFPGNYPGVIYDLQISTANTLKAAENCEDIYIINKLTELYSIPFEHLKKDPNDYGVWPISGQGTYEEILSSSQFMYAAAKLLNVILHIDESKWTPAMRKYYVSSSSYKVKPRQELIGHLDRWINKKSMWTWKACGYKEADALREYTNPEYIARKRAKTLGYKAGAPHYCNALLDIDLWIGATAAEMVDADDEAKRRGLNTGLSAELKAQLSLHVQSVARLFESRVSTKISTSPLCGGACTVGLLDSGGRRGHPEYPANLWPNNDDTWDISHAQRLVQFIDSVYGNPQISNPPAKYTEEYISNLFARSIAYSVFNGNFKDPAFTNFLNGSNVDYPRSNITYGPYSFSKDFFGSGYAFWSSTDTNLQKIVDAVTEILDNKTPTTYLTPSGALPSKIDLMEFYSSLTQ